MNNYQSLINFNKYLLLLVWIFGVLLFGILLFLALDGEDIIILIENFLVLLLVFFILIGFGHITKFLLDIRCHQLAYESDNNESKSSQKILISESIKYKLLKFLSPLFIASGWFALVVAIYSTIINLDFEEDMFELLIPLSIGILLFVFLNTFGKLIPLIFDIRKFQLEKAATIETPSDVSPNNLNNGNESDVHTIGVNMDNLKLLNFLLKKQKGTLFGKGNKVEIINTIGALIHSGDDAKNVIYQYKKLYNKDLVSELKNLTSSYAEKKEFLDSFIIHNIVKSEYPHDLLI